MQQHLLDRVGDWNPQLYRELKGNLTPRKLILAVLFSLGLQAILLLFAYINNIRLYKGGTALSSLQEYLLDLSQDYFVLSAIAVPVMLLVGGTYLLIRDLSREQEQGTLNFIQLSPQPVSSILLGKFLGVPSLLYLGVAIAIPLNLIASLIISVPLGETLAYYGAVITATGFYFTIALLIGLVSSRESRAFSAGFGASLMFIVLLIILGLAFLTQEGLMVYASFFSPATIIPTVVQNYNPYFLSEFPITSTLELLVWMLVNYAVWTYWVSCALQRRFRDPQACLWSKPQSYGMTLCLNVFALWAICGFDNDPSHGIAITDHLMILLTLNSLVGVFWVFALSPLRQPLWDWARYRYEVTTQRHLGQELLWHDRSPATFAIVIHTIIMSLPLAIALVLFPDANTYDVLLLLTFYTLHLWFYSAIVQLIFVGKRKNPFSSALLALLALYSLPSMVLGLLNIQTPSLWLLTLTPWVDLSGARTMFDIVVAVVTEMSVIAGLNLSLQHRLQLVGRSESKQLLEVRGNTLVSR